MDAAHRNELGRTFKKYRRALLTCACLVLFYMWRSSDPHTGSIARELGTCPDYGEWSQTVHEPLSEGQFQLSYMRPVPKCRTFKSHAVEQVIEDLRVRFEDPDIFRIFENAFPNTLDTTIWWHEPLNSLTKTPRTFVATGDIPAEWLRDSARQLSVYQPLTKYDEDLRLLVKGAIIQQSLYVMHAAFCNAFQPPDESGIKKVPSSKDYVVPRPDWNVAFECKWELDSLASFLGLTNEYIENSGDLAVLSDEHWLAAFRSVMYVLVRQSHPTFDPTGRMAHMSYLFKRETTLGSETLPLGGLGNPVAGGTGMVKSAFRPSDDACIFQFFIPANAQMAVELEKVAGHLKAAGLDSFASQASRFAKRIRAGIAAHAIIDHPRWGKVYAYEVDGYGGTTLMDDANQPSLLSLPDMGFLDVDDEVYQNTRKMVLSKDGNPYYVLGRYFEGIGGPHIGLRAAWPMSLLVRIRTTDDDKEILGLLKRLVSTTSGLGLMHESIDVASPSNQYSRSWFAWCNSEYAKTILDLAERKPYLIFNDKYKETPYKIDEHVRAKAAKAAKADAVAEPEIALDIAD